LKIRGIKTLRRQGAGKKFLASQPATHYVGWGWESTLKVSREFLASLELIKGGLRGGKIRIVGEGKN
jgi:hypothetical protein